MDKELLKAQIETTREKLNDAITVKSGAEIILGISVVLDRLIEEYMLLSMEQQNC